MTNTKKTKMHPTILIAFIALIIAAAVVPGTAQTGSLRILAAGRELPPGVRAEQRGQRITLPIGPLARQFGYTTTVDAVAETITVHRAGVEAQFVKRSGEVRENGVTVISVPFAAEVVFPLAPDTIQLPLEAVGALLNVSIFIDKKTDTVRVDLRDQNAGATDTTTEKHGKFEVGGLNYVFNLISQNGFYYPGFGLTSTGRYGDSTYRSNINFLGGGTYRLVNFYSGNFTLSRPNKDEFQFGDLSTTVGTELNLMTTQVRGASFSHPILDGRARISVYGGRTFNGLLENNFVRSTPALPFDTTAGGARFTFRPTVLKPNVVSRRTVLFSAGVIAYKGKRNSGVLVDTAAYFNTDRYNLQVELAAAKSNLTRLDGRNINGVGFGMVFSGSYRPRRFFTVQGRYEYYSPNFSEPSRISQYNNRESKSASVTFQPFRNLTFGASASISDQKNPLLFRNLPIARLRTETYGASFGYDPPTRFLPRISITATQFKNPFFGKFTLISTSLAREFKRFRPFANHYLSIRDGVANHSVTLGTGIQAGSAGQFQVQHNFSFSKSPVVSEEDIRCALDPLGCPRQSLSRLRINNSGTFVDWTPNRPLFGKLQFNIGGGYTREPLRGTSPEYHASVSYSAPFRQNIQFSFFHTAFNQEFRITISGPLNFWKSKSRLSDEVTESALLTESKISGRVYLDENGNRQYDAGVDTAMPNVRVRLNNGVEVASDINGYYSFEHVQPGDSQLSVNIEDVRANLIPANGLEQTLTILPRTSVTTAFRLVRSGSLSGRVWNDANANGKYDTGEGMADIRIVASSGRDTYTDPDGSFLLTELPPGDQNVFIDERYKPEDFIIPASSLRVTVESGKETHGVQFLFAVKSRGVKEIDFGTKAAPALSPNAAGRPKTKTREK